MFHSWDLRQPTTFNIYALISMGMSFSRNKTWSGSSLRSSLRLRTINSRLVGRWSIRCQSMMTEDTAFLLVLAWIAQLVVAFGWGVANGHYCYWKGRLDELDYVTEQGWLTDD